MVHRLLNFFAVVSSATAFTTGSFSTYTVKTVQQMQINSDEPIQNKMKPFGAVAATAALTFLIAATPQAALASNAAAQITIDSIPPSSLQLDAKGVPVVGGVVSGRYAMVDDADLGPASIIIKAPKSTQALLKGLSAGHLEVDLGGLVTSHLDVDIAAKSGEATVKVRSNIIPALPFKNSASGDESAKGGKKSDWSKVTNMGDGSVYFYNEKTDQSQFNEP